MFDLPILGVSLYHTLRTFKYYPLFFPVHGFQVEPVGALSILL
jgi:hypothetical protein